MIALVTRYDIGVMRIRERRACQRAVGRISAPSMQTKDSFLETLKRFPGKTADEVQKTILEAIKNAGSTREAQELEEFLAQFSHYRKLASQTSV